MDEDDRLLAGGVGALHLGQLGRCRGHGAVGHGGASRRGCSLTVGAARAADGPLVHGRVLVLHEVW